MDAAAIKRACELFQVAADLPRHERGAYLKARCADNELFTFVAQMLADHEKQSAGPLDAPVFEGARAAELMPKLPTRLGQYELVRVLGEGGMAVVYEARQQSPSRTVAIKVLRPGVLSAELLRRFQHEVQVLGQLQHEGIAHIYEADVAETALADGSVIRQPYYVMELIRGEPLTTYARQHALSDGQKLELVARVCDAVQYAHQKGVIHRDLKPANILVEGDEAERPADGESKGKSGGHHSSMRSGSFGGGRPRVLDFGVARVMGAELDAPTMNTEAGRLIGTLAYMSPEQVGGEVEQTDTRSDVYALGVILYELLSGQLPHEVKDLSLPEAARRVREVEPPRLSVLDKRFRGDIDVMVARAMDKERSRRYPTALELGADLRRHLAGEAIEARRDSAIYVLRKNMRRHRTLAAASVAVLLGLIAFAAYASVQAHKFEKLSSDEHRARIAAESVNKFLAGVIELANPNPGRGYALTLTDMLDDATHRLDSGELAHDPDVEAQVRATLAQTYDNLELTDGVIIHRKWLAEYHRKHGGDASSEYLRALTELGNAYVESSRQPEAQETLKKGLALAQSLYGKESLEAFRIMNTIGNSLMRDGRAPESLDWAIAATNGVAGIKGEQSCDTGFVYFNIAGIYRNLRRSEEMLFYYEKALKIMEAQCPDNLSTVRCRWSYANDVLRKGGRLDEAETALRRALDLCTRSMGAEHPETLATQRALAGVLQDKGDLDQAKAILIQAMETCRGLRRWASPTESAMAKALAVCFKARGELDESAASQRVTLDRFEKARGRADPLVIQMVLLLSSIEKDRGDSEQAGALLQDAAQRLVDDHHETDPRVNQWRAQAAAMRKVSK